MFAFVSFAVLGLSLLSAAQLIPTGPAPNNVFKQGTPCTISWTADTSGKWKSTFIELMTGPNQPMVHLSTVAMVDGTDPTKTSIAVPCPAVTPNAAIYFYQFTAQGQNASWTGRFAISDANGATSSPPNANQPDGEAIPWGTGKLLDASLGTPPPPTAPPGQIDGSVINQTSSAPVLSASAPSNSSAPSISTPASTPTPPTVSSSPAASTSEMTTVVVTAATSSPAASTSPASTGSTSSNSATVQSLSAAAALIASTVLVIVTFH